MNYLSIIWKGNADANGFIVIAPEGTAPLGNGFTWNSSDEALILAAASDVYACYAIDPKKEIIHGFSAGGIMAYFIGLHDAARFSGISISSADLGSAEAIYGGFALALGVGNPRLPFPRHAGPELPDPVRDRRHEQARPTPATRFTGTRSTAATRRRPRSPRRCTPT